MRDAYETYVSSNNRQLTVHGVKALPIDWEAPEKAFESLSNINPDIIVNAVGYTNVDDCQRNPELSYCANVKVAEPLEFKYPPLPE